MTKKLDNEEPEFWLPFGDMKIGDSFWFPTLQLDKNIYMMDVVSKEVGIKVKCYPAIKDGILGLRVWRIG
jgi:hypothetical protein